MSTEDIRIQIAIEEAEKAGVLRSGGLPVLVDITARDDCAVLQISPALDLVIGSDFIRGTEFYLFGEGEISFEDIGWYLVAANISDLAAMGATPAGVVVAIRYARDLSDEEWRAVLRGVCKACSAFDTALLGGDSGGYTANVLSAAAIGTVPHGRALLRSGGLAGDRLFITGSVGLAGAAVAYFYRGRHRGASVAPEVEERLRDSWRRASPAYRQGPWLAESGLCRCCIDTSDGLKAALFEIAARSEVDVVVAPDAVPIDPAANVVANVMALNPMELGMSDSVDFRLLFAIPEAHSERVREYFKRQGWGIHEIGFLRESSGPPRVTAVGDYEIPGLAWDQSDTATVDRLLKRRGRDELP